MKSISPVRSIRNNTSSSSDQILGISRSKSPALDDPLSLLYNMNHCYSLLKDLVPSLPQNRSVSKMEILQHVIDYILDLQIALDSSSLNCQQQQQQQQRLQGHSGSRIPLSPSAVTSDLSLRSGQSNALARETDADVDSSALLR